MNKHILTVIDNQLNPEKYTKEQLKDNADAAATAYDIADEVDDEVAEAAYAAAAEDADATYTDTYVYTDAAGEDAHLAACAAYYWVNEYFKHAGENKQDYIDAINRDK